MQILDSKLFSSSCGSSFISDRRTGGLQSMEVAALLRAANQRENTSSAILDTVEISSAARRACYSNQEAILSGFSIIHSTEGDSDRIKLIETADVRTKTSLSSIEQTNSVTAISAGGSLPDGWSVKFSSTSVHYESERMRVIVRGSVTTQDGEEITFAIDLGLSREYTSIDEETVASQAVSATTDPLVINFRGGMPGLSDTKFAFDINSDGSRELVYAAASGSGFLAFDKNGDGMINNGSELFGPATGNGFTELSGYDSDKNGWIDENDGIFAQLSIWTKDEAGNDKLLTLKEADVGALSLSAVSSSFSLTDDANRLKGRVRSTGIYLSEQANVGVMQQIDLASEGMNEKIPEEEDAGLGQQQTGLSRKEVSERLINLNRLAVIASRLAEQGRAIRQSFKDNLESARKGQGGSLAPEHKILSPIEQMIKSLQNSVKEHSRKSKEYQKDFQMHPASGFEIKHPR
jgi:hypothetical protein